MSCLRLRDKYSLVLLVVWLIFLGGCSYQYRLERRIYQASRKVRLAVAQADSLLDSEYRSLVGELLELELKAKERGLEFAVQRLLAELFVARGDKKRLEALASRIRKKYQAQFYQDVFSLAMLHRDYDLAFRVLNEVERKFADESSFAVSVPFLKCMVERKSGKSDHLCSYAVEFYENKTKSSDLRDRFVGYRGLFLTYLAENDKKKALDWLERMIFDPSMPPKVAFRGLAEEVALLRKMGEMERIRSVLKQFKEKNISRMDKNMQKRLDMIISKLEKVARKKSEDEDSNFSD